MKQILNMKLLITFTIFICFGRAAFDEECFQLTNGLRSRFGIPQLGYSQEAEAMCYYHSQCMANAGSMSHCACDCFGTRLSQFGINRRAAENIAAVVSSAQQAYSLWRNSSGMHFVHGIWRLIAK